MKSFVIKFQTSELVPPPYAFAIEFNINNEDYVFDLEYLDRDGLTEEEILDEGFSVEGNLELAGKLPSVWRTNIENLLKISDKTYPKEIAEKDEFCIIETEGDAFTPKNVNAWKTMLEELQQAFLEQNKFEAPLEIKILRITHENKSFIKLNASFENQILSVDINGKKNILDWKNLNPILKNIFSGDYNYDKSLKTEPKKNGLFVNFGDEFWLEVGVSLLIKPSKITAWLDDL